METLTVYRNFCLAAVTFLAAASGTTATLSQAEDAESTGKSVLQRYTLRYTLKKGEQLHYEVTHAAKTKTRTRRNPLGQPFQRRTTGDLRTRG